MSEFSESYHLRSEKIDEGVQLLTQSGLKGFVYPPVNSWVTFVSENGMFEPDKKIVAANNGLLLHFVFAEDHGWNFSFFDHQKKLSSYSCSWDEEVDINLQSYSAEIFKSIHGLDFEETKKEVEKYLRPKSFDEIADIEPARKFAEALKLKHFEWLAFDYVAREFHTEPGRFPGVIKV